MTSASFITSQQGTRFSPFITPRPDATWPGIIKTEETPYYTHQIPLGTNNRQHFGVGSTSAYNAKEGRRFPFLQEGEISFATGVVLEAASAVCQPLLKTVAAPPESGGGGGRSKMFSDELTRVLDSDCALSLLSAPANSSGIDVRMVRPTEQVPPLAQQPLLSGLQFGSASWFSRPHQAAAAAATGMASEQQQQQLNTVLGGASDGEMNYNGMFHVGGEGSSDGTASSLPILVAVVVPCQ